MCAKHDLQRNNKYRAEPEKLTESKEAKILWDFPVQTNIQMRHSRPDIILINHWEKTGFLIIEDSPSKGWKL